ncbi:MAG: iron-sulfur cluster assembly protein [Candidatus Thorarchaeota archaeon]
MTQEVNLKEQIEKLLGDVMHPAINASLVELGIVKEINTSNGKIEILFAFPFANIPIEGQLVNSVRAPLSKLGLDIEVSTSIMNESERIRFLAIEHAKWRI